MKILLLTFVAVLLSANVFSQADDLYYSNKKGTVSEQAKVDMAKTHTSNYLDLSGKYLEKSAKFQYAAIGCAAVSIGTSIFAGITMSSTAPDGEKDVEKWYKDKKKTARACYIASGTLGVVAIVCEFISIDYKMKSGHYIRLHASGDGVGVGVNF